MKSISSMIAKLRKERGMTQEQLADLADIPVRTLQTWESYPTRVRADKLAAIADALGVKDMNLFFDSEDHESNASDFEAQLAEENQKFLEHQKQFEEFCRQSAEECARRNIAEKEALFVAGEPNHVRLDDLNEYYFDHRYGLYDLAYFPILISQLRAKDFIVSYVEPPMASTPLDKMSAYFDVLVRDEDEAQRLTEATLKILLNLKSLAESDYYKANFEKLSTLRKVYLDSMTAQTPNYQHFAVLKRGDKLETALFDGVDELREIIRMTEPEMIKLDQSDDFIPADKITAELKSVEDLIK